MTQPVTSPLVFRNPDGSDIQITLDYMYNPAPPPKRTKFGDTQRSVSGGLAEVDKAYGGPGATARVYFTGAPGQIPPDRAVIASFKQAQTTAAGLASLALAERRFYFHEIDHQERITPKAPITRAQWKTDMIAMGLTDVCLTADCFVNTAKNPADYLVDGVTHIGVDFDGISGGTSYHDYSKALAAVIAFCDAHGLTWGVPEFGTDRQTWDTDGSGRAAWLIYWAGKFRAAGAEYVCVWEYSAQPGSLFTAAAEITAVRALLALA